jgi:hypothetical protein
MIECLKERGVKGDLYRAPTGIDSGEIYPTKKSLELRKKYGVVNKKVLFYIGKIGDLYYTNEIPMLFNMLRQEIPDLVFLVLTPNDLGYVNRLFEVEGVSKQDYKVIDGRMKRSSINEYIGVGDIGLCAVPPTPAQKFRSPTKVGEYLMAGVPFITSKGVSEDDIYAKKFNVGVVLEEFNRDVIALMVEDIKVLLDEPKEEQLKRCRKIGKEYRSKQYVVDVLKKIYSKIEED